MATDQNSPLDDLTDDELAALKELARAKANDGFQLSRRDLLSLATGGAVGGGAALSALGSAAADASTSDSDGNVGLPGDRVDVFADGVDTPTITDTDTGTTHDVGNDLAGGALSDSGTDTDGGNDYVLPNAADNIDLQSDGAIQSADDVSTTALSINSRQLYIQDSKPSSLNDGDIWIDTS